MRQVFFAALVCALAGFSSGCKLCDGLGWNGHGGCASGGCAHGNCGPGCGTAGCPDGACGADGHSSPYEPLYHGHAGAPHRNGLISAAHNHHALAAAGMGGPGMGGPGMGGAGMGGPGMGGMQGTPPQSAGAVSYPYYTTRGPRDFLAPNPRGIGP